MCGFLGPLPLVRIWFRYTVLNSRNLPYFVRMAPTPPPPSRCERHVSIAPKSGDGGFDNTEHIQTGTYGLALDVSSANLIHFGLLQDPLPVEEALVSDNSVVTSLPAGNVSYSVVLDSDGDGVETEYSATGFFNTDGTTENPSQMIDMGRFMQRVEIPQVLS